MSPSAPLDPAPNAPRVDLPNRPGRGLLVLAFVGILIAGALGGAIGWGIVDTSCTEELPVGEQLVDTVPGTEVESHSCDAALVTAALGGAALAAIGAGIVAALMLRAQSEWRAHPPGSSRRGRVERINPTGSGESSPHT